MRLIVYFFFFITINHGFESTIIDGYKDHMISSYEDKFYNELAIRSKDIASVTADFVQSKYINLVKETVISKGVFYYKKSGNVRFDYTSPKIMSIIMNPYKLYIVSAGKETMFKLDKQKGLSDLARVMGACISGDLNAIPNTYKWLYKPTADRHSIIILPKSIDKFCLYSKIELFLNESDFSLDEIILYEKSNDYTIYRFSNIILNRNISKKIFFYE